MAFGTDDEGEGLNDINITPFVDVVLVLLVIFMVTAPAMIKEALKVKLPRTLTSDLSGQSASVAIAITKEGQLLLNGALVSRESLEQELRRYGQSAPQTQFLLSADVDSRHGALVEVIDLLKLHRLERFALQVEKVKGQP